MRKRFQNGCVKKSKDGRYWIAQWRENDDAGGRRQQNRLLGKVSQMTKSKARKKVAEIVKPINESAAVVASNNVTVKKFFKDFYLPFFKRKWKVSTAQTNEDRVKHHIVNAFENRELRTLTRDELQTFLDSKASLSFSTVDHLRWDLNQMFDMAVAEGVILRNPASLLFTPRECTRPVHRSLTAKEVKRVFEALELRERLIVKLAILAGMRPGEIFGLRRGRVGECASIQERVYRENRYTEDDKIGSFGSPVFGTTAVPRCMVESVAR
jgi:integrase